MADESTARRKSWTSLKRRNKWVIMAIEVNRAEVKCLVGAKISSKKPFVLNTSNKFDVFNDI